MLVTSKRFARPTWSQTASPTAPLGMTPVGPSRNSVSNRLALVAGFLVQALTPASAQIRVTQASAPLEISLEKVVEIGDPDGPGALGRPNEVDQRENGEWILTDNVTPGEVKFFSESGAWVRTIGRQGSGPGEYTYAWFIHPLSDNGVEIGDFGNFRITTYDPSLTVTKTRRLFSLVRGICWLPEERIAGTFLSFAHGEQGQTLHLFDAEGKLERSFGRTFSLEEGRNSSSMRTLAKTGGSTFWVANLTRYLLEEWDSQGNLIQALERHVDWFQPHTRYAVFRKEDGPPNPGITAMRADASGRLWVVIKVPDPAWEEAFVMGKGPYGLPKEVVGDLSDYFDSMVEVVDPASREVVASLRLDEDVQGFTSAGDIYFTRFAEGMIPVVDVLRLSLMEPGEGG